MKNLIKLLSAAFIFGAFFMSCEGPEGPAGEDGIDGIDGKDGNLTCLECHSTEVMDDIYAEFSLTKHVTGSSWARGTSSSCGRCHSHDGYVEYVRSGEEIGADVSTPLQCSTCHDAHTSLEDDISAPLRDIDEVVAMVDENITFDHGKGNICASCHQARRDGSEYDKFDTDTSFTVTFDDAEDIAYYKNTTAIGPNGTITEYGTDSVVVVFDVPTTHVYVSSTHAGPHHGPQANMFAGIVGYPTTGPAFDRAGHTDCAGCHLNDSTAGYGHSFEPDVTQCNDCHGSAVDIAGIQADFQTRLDAIETELEAIHAIHVVDGSVHPVLASLTRDQYQAFYNFMCVIEDKSVGVHNPDYTEIMLSLAETNLGLK